MSDQKATQRLIPIGRSGIVEYGGRLHFEDVERAWRGTERDRTILRMQNDPVIGSVLHAIDMLVRGVDWTVEAADDSDDAKAIAEFVDECLDDMDGYWPGDTLSSMLSYIPWGWWVGEIVYKIRGGADATDVARRSQYNDGRIGWRSWQSRPQATRDGWLFDEYGDAIGLRQRDPQSGALIDIPLDRCLHLVYASKTNSPEGWTPLRPAYEAWYHKRGIQQIEAIGIERDLAGLPVIRVPGNSIKAQDAVYDWAVATITGLKNDDQAGVVLASDRDEKGNFFQDIALLSTGGQRAFDTDKIIRRFANEMVTVFLANVMRTGQDGIGALALSETQSGLFQQAIAAHLDIIGDAINTQAIPALMRVNGLNQDLAPQVKHGRLDTVDLQNFGQYLVRLADTGILLDTPELRKTAHEIAGLPVGNLPTQDEIDDQRVAWQAARGGQSGPTDGGA